jgi:hypothetical protein
VKEKIDKNEEIKVDAFPSVKTTFYTVFYRFYAENRDPELQDVFDILIFNVVPYLDIVVTERFQGEIFRKIKNRDEMYQDIEILTLRDLRNF